MLIARHERVLLSAALVALSILFLMAPYALSQSSGDSLAGYTWSETVGWTSLSCESSDSCGTSNYKIAVASNGGLSGYAWNDSIGWISANSADLSGCPISPCSAAFDDGVLSGWLRAIGLTDGWISLSGTSAASTYGVFASATGNLYGHAWGSEPIGWMDFSYATSTQHICTPTYSCTEAGVLNSCTGQVAVCLSGQICSAGACQDTYSCVDETPPTHRENNRTSEISQCVDGPVYDGICSGNVCTFDYPAPEEVSFLDSEGETERGAIHAEPSLVRKGDSTKVYWNVINVEVESCRVEGTNGDLWVGLSSSGPDGVSTEGILEQTIFTLTCTWLDGSTQYGPESTTVNIAPVFQER